MNYRRKRRTLNNILSLYHYYFKKSGFYKFAIKNALKVVAAIVVLVIGLYLLDVYVLDVTGTFEHLTQTLKPVYVYLLFLTSETLFGLIPPDIFIAWANQFDSPWLTLTLLAFISYLGGVIGYGLGRSVRLISTINNSLTIRFSRHMKSIKAWGGFVIIFAALFPLPFSTICITAGMMRYPFVPLLVFGLTRFLRFYIYALAIFRVI